MPIPPPAPVRFRLCYTGNFCERHSRVFEASSRRQLYSGVRECRHEVRADGLLGKLTVQAECRFLHNGEEVVEWRSVGPDAPPIDTDGFLEAMLRYGGRCFTEGAALASGADPAAASG